MTQIKKEDQTKNENQTKKEASASPLLERFLQRNMTDRMRDIDDESLAKAIKTLLHDDKNKKHLN